MGLSLKQFDGATVTPKDDAIMYDQMSSDFGIIKGCKLEILSTNQVSLSAGYMLIHGRLIEVIEENINCKLPAGDGSGRIYVQMDLQNTLEPVKILTQATTGSLPELHQDEEVNFTNGIFEMELATYTATATALQTLTETAPEVKGGAAADAITFDNTKTTLQAEDVQGAIEEEDGKIEEINNNLSGFQLREVDGQAQYKLEGEGADAWRPFKEDSIKVNLVSNSGNTMYSGYYFPVGNHKKVKVKIEELTTPYGYGQIYISGIVTGDKVYKNKSYEYDITGRDEIYVRLRIDGAGQDRNLTATISLE